MTIEEARVFFISHYKEIDPSDDMQDETAPYLRAITLTDRKARREELEWLRDVLLPWKGLRNEPGATFDRIDRRLKELDHAD